ncbi:MAG: serine/threonine protein kinase [Myxococcales bacterium]|nr:serine/threonine protein kinase [Myxococcales bacterium]MCB9709255.1 serine/threonine protein kinase [Myxococcales bacterium]
MFLSGLLQLHHAKSPGELERIWRQSMASLGTAALDQRPAPLEGLPPETVLAGVRVALAQNLVDNLDWLSAPAAAVALYELAAAIPVGPERHQLGRRVAMRLRDGNAATFVALATALAISSRRGLAGPDVQARVALALDLPLGSAAHVDALALALISRPQLEAQWLSEPSTGSLPSRRLAANLLERAARQAALRASQGDAAGLRIFDVPSVKAAWNRLLEDRESLVWGHVATARGLLSEHVPSFDQDIRRELLPSGSIGEWRRAAASLAASMASHPDDALERCRRILDDTIFKQDPGIAGTMVLGVPRAAEVEPDAASELLLLLVERASNYVAEACVELRHQQINGVGETAFRALRSNLSLTLHASSNGDVGERALYQCLLDELSDDTASPSNAILRQAHVALQCFVEESAKAAALQAEHTLQEVAVASGKLSRIVGHSEHELVQAFQLQRNLDTGLLKQTTLRNLLRLDARDASPESFMGLERSMVSVGAWLIRPEHELQAFLPQTSSLWHQHRLRMLLHLVDSDWADSEPDTRRHRITTLKALFHLISTCPPKPLHRLVFATTTRALDALVRDELCEISDALLVIMDQNFEADDLEIIAEASMLPEIKEPVRHFCALVRTFANTRGSSAGAIGTSLDILAMFISSLASGSPRLDALRHALVQLTSSIEAMVAVRGLAELTDPNGALPFQSLAHATQTLALLIAGATRRLELSGHALSSEPLPQIKELEIALEQALREERALHEPAVIAVVQALAAELPVAIADLCATVLVRLLSRPNRAPELAHVAPAPKAAKTPSLPPWLPPGRTLGGFYVLRKLGSGGVASVFVAKRIEERHSPHAKLFALKVPEYSGNVARTLSEAEFGQMFREEASALLTLPEHPNLSKFVTFDAGVKPKPILVMELVEGVSLERAISMRDIDSRTAFRILDGLGDGLSSMHSASIAHLDVKPSNVILRPSAQSNHRGVTPVLVDFGLAGTRLRPGCATTLYGAPEIWSLNPSDPSVEPMPADVYAFACLAYELLIGKPLFEADSEIAAIARHIGHDGRPPEISALAKIPELERLAHALSKALRRDPRARCTIQELRSELAALAPSLKNHRWPIA